jgi:NitT/TauT family transport system substrate-binding protein
MTPLSRKLPAALVAAAALVVAVIMAAGLAACGSDGTTTTSGAVSTVTTGPSTTSGPSTTAEATSTSQATSTSEAVTSTSTAAAKLPKLTLVGPPGPMAIPLAYMVVNNKLADVADKTEVVVWENADQLRAYVAGKQGDFVTMPSNNSAIFYNKGLKLQLLDISVWNITYLITSDDKASSFADIKGESLAVPFQGSVPDLMFQSMAKAAGLDPLKDFEVRYATDPTQAAQLLVSGQVGSAVLSEALATAVILQTKDTARPLHRAFAFDKAWSDSAGGDSPIAGTVATASVMDRPDVIKAFEREYQAAVQWMLDNPEEAGKLVETQLPQLGLKAAVMTASLKNITWRYTPAAEVRASLDQFYQNLAELSPEVIGGKVPDDAFYFDGAQ